MFAKRKLNEKCFYSIMVIGGFSAVYQVSYADEIVLSAFFPGMLMTIVATFMGGFIGFLLKDALRWLRGLRPYSGQYYDGMLLGSAAGCFVGSLAQIVSFSHDANVALGALFGSMIGGFIGSLPDEVVPPLVRLVASGEMDDEAVNLAANMLEKSHQPIIAEK